MTMSRLGLPGARRWARCEQVPVLCRRSRRQPRSSSSTACRMPARMPCCSACQLGAIPSGSPGPVLYSEDWEAVLGSTRGRMTAHVPRRQFPQPNPILCCLVLEPNSTEIHFCNPHLQIYWAASFLHRTCVAPPGIWACFTCWGFSF